MIRASTTTMHGSQDSADVRGAASCQIGTTWTQSCVGAGQDKEVVEGAMVYLYLSAPALWCYSAVECMKRYLLSQVPRTSSRGAPAQAEA